MLPALMALPYKVFANPVLCPVCTFAVAGGLGLARWLGVCNGVIGVWIGAALLAFSQWTVYFFEKRNLKQWWIKVLCYVGWYSTIIPLYMGKKPSLCFNCYTILGIDIFIFSVICGSLAAVAGGLLYEYLKKKNNGKAHFPYEKVVMPVVLILAVSLLFNLCKESCKY